MAEQPQRYRHLEGEIPDLIAKLEFYDTHGQTGYLGMGVNDLILGETRRRLEEKAQSGGA